MRSVLRAVFALTDMAVMLTRQRSMAAVLPAQRTETQCTFTARPWPPQRSSWRLSGRLPAGRLAHSGRPEVWGTDPSSSSPPWRNGFGRGAACVVGRSARSSGGSLAERAAAPQGPAREAGGSCLGFHCMTRGLADRRTDCTRDIEGGTAMRRPALVAHRRRPPDGERLGARQRGELDQSGCPGVERVDG
jgi:hypothetical protein